MKKKKLFLLISIVTILLVGVASISYAATVYNSPAEIIAGLIGKSVDDAVAARQAGASFGAQAEDAGKLTEFQAARLELYKQRLDQAVTDKKITQEDADKLYQAMEFSDIPFNTKRKPVIKADFFCTKIFCLGF